MTSKEDKRTRGAEMKSMKSLGLLLVVALFLLAGMLLAGCGGDDEATTTTAAAGSETAGAATPRQGPRRAVIRWSSEPSCPPRAREPRWASRSGTCSR